MAGFERPLTELAVYDALILVSERHECTDLELLAAIQNVQRRILAQELARSRGKREAT